MSKCTFSLPFYIRCYFNHAVTNIGNSIMFPLSAFFPHSTKNDLYLGGRAYIFPHISFQKFWTRCIKFDVKLSILGVIRRVSFSSCLSNTRSAMPEVHIWVISFFLTAHRVRLLIHNLNTTIPYISEPVSLQRTKHNENIVNYNHVFIYDVISSATVFCLQESTYIADHIICGACCLLWRLLSSISCTKGSWVQISVWAWMYVLVAFSACIVLCMKRPWDGVILCQWSSLGSLTFIVYKLILNWNSPKDLIHKDWGRRSEMI
jgi:hypothetical protein